MTHLTNEMQSLLGKKVLLMCANYFYTGKVVSANDSFIKLDNAAIVYETGPWNTTKFLDEQNIGDSHYVMINAIESFRQVD